MSAPFYYDYINAVEGNYSPSTVHSKNTSLTHFFSRLLLQKAMSVFKWTMPKTWNSNFVKSVLYGYGYFVVINTDKFGVIPQPCGLTGYNVQYQPTHCIITNPLISKTLRPEIDVNCVLVKMRPDYCGIMDIVGYYADMLSVSAEAVGVNLLNSKVAYVMGAGNTAIAESFRKMMDSINAGNPAVVADKKLFNSEGKPEWDYFVQGVKNNYIAGDVVELMKNLYNEFCTHIGINNANTDKKERMLVDEVNANNQDVRSLAELWLDELQDGCKRAKDMFGIDLSVDWRESNGVYDSGNVPVRPEVIRQS